MPAERSERTSNYSAKKAGGLLSDVDEEAEMRLLSCLIHPKVTRRDIGLLPQPSDLSNDRYREVYTSLIAVIQEKGTMDATLLFHDLRSKGVDPDRELFRSLKEMREHPEFIADYAGVVHELAVRRLVKETGLLIAEKAAKHTGSSDELLAMMQESMEKTYRESSVSGAASELVSFQQALETAWSKIVDPSLTRMLKFGIGGVDEATGGMREGELLVIGGKSGDGKTSLVMQFILNSAALSGKRWLFVTKEMAPEDIALRVLLMRAKINNLEIRRSQMDGTRLSKDSWDRLREAKAQLMEMQSAEGLASIMFMPPGHASARSICSMIRREKMANGLDGFAVDYLQILDKPEGGRANETEEYQIRRDCQDFKNVAVSERLCGVLLSQYTKGDSGRRTKDGTEPRPTMEYLKGSQGVQAAADLIFLLHRPEPPNEFDASLTYPVDCIIAKGRSTGTSVVHLDFEPQITQFSDRDAPPMEGETKY